MEYRIRRLTAQDAAAIPGLEPRMRMDKHIREWLFSFNCDTCSAEVGSLAPSRRAVSDPGDREEPEVIGFCYRHAATYVGRWDEQTPSAAVCCCYALICCLIPSIGCSA